MKPLKRRDTVVGRDIPGDRDEFNRVQALLKSGNKAAARQGFKDFVQRFPDSRLTDDALLQLGDIYRDQGKLRDAAGAYQRIIEQFPTSDTIHSATYNYGLTKYELGEIDDAMPLLESIDTRKFPDEFRLSFLEVLREGHKKLKATEALIRTDLQILDIKRGDPELRDEVIALIGELDEKQVSKLATSTKGRFPSGYAYMRLANQHFNNGEFGKAKGKLKTFLSKFRDEGTPHEYTEDAELLLSRLQRLETTVPGRVGVLLPLSGPFAGVGRRILNGIVLAADLLNKEAAVENEVPIELIVRDSAGSEEQAAKAIEDLVLDQQVAVILGPMLKKTTEKAATLAQKFKVPTIVMSQDEEIAAKSDFIFQNCLRKSDQAKALVKYATDYLGVRRFAMMHPQHSYGKDMFWMIWDELNKVEGVSVTGVEAYQRDEADFGPHIRRLTGLFYLKARPEPICRKKRQDKSKRSNCFERDSLPPIVDFEALIIPDSAEKIRQIAPTLSYYGVRGVQLLGGNLWHSNELLEKDAPSYVQGATFVDGFFAGSKEPVVQQFVERYKKEFDEEPDLLAAQAFDSMRMLTAAHSQIQLGKREQIKRFFANLQDFNGAAGKTSFAADGTPRKQLYFFMVDGKKFKPLYDDEGNFPQVWE